MRIPVIRGHIGDWRYYTGIMKFSTIAKVVSPSVDDFCNPSCLNDLLQRQLTENYIAIKDYLNTDKQRFFNAIVLAIYDGDPKWLEIEFGDEYEEYNNVGFLEFNEDNNDIKIFPVDGQHRVKGIIEAIKENKTLENEEVSVIIIGHKNDVEGKRRTRKLFSTLNRRAKPVGDNYQIALDEDDIVAIITRELIEEVELFQGDRMANYSKKQIPNGNVSAFTSLLCLYQCNNFLVQRYLNLKEKEFKEYKLCRPDNETIDRVFEWVKEYWTAFIENIPVIQEYLKISKDAAALYRNPSGGNILFRPIGLIEFVKASIIIMEQSGESIEFVIKRLSVIPMELSSRLWKSVMWDGKKIINRVKLDLIRLLILYIENPNNINDEELIKLVNLYANALNYEGDLSDVRALLEEIRTEV